MTGELIPTGVTFGTGRKSINESFSGTAEFNNVSLDSGGDFSGGTGGGVLYSGGTDLYSIFITSGDGNDITRVQPGTNIFTGGTANDPVVNLVDSPSVNNFSFSGIATGGDVYASNLTGGTIYSGTSEMSDIIRSFSGTSGDLWAESIASYSIIMNNNSGNTSNSSNSLVTGVNNQLDSTSSVSTILGGSSNAIASGVQGINAIINSTNSGAFVSTAPGVFCSGNTIISSQSSTISGQGGASIKNAILNCRNSDLVDSTGSTMISCENLSISEYKNTTIMQRGYIDEYIDLNPQKSTAPDPVRGRMFFSGGTFNKMMYNSGGTSSDWVII